MRAPGRGKGSVYEVRCPRCDVSFPVETKRCFHCGGPTAQVGAYLSGEPENVSMATEIFDAQPPIGIDEGAFEAGEPQQERAAVSSAEEWSEQGGVQPEDEAPSFVKSLLRSFGGFVWIALLIAFSLARDCGD